jgi:hypothetical protein
MDLNALKENYLQKVNQVKQRFDSINLELSKLRERDTENNSKISKLENIKDELERSISTLQNKCSTLVIPPPTGAIPLTAVSPTSPTTPKPIPSMSPLSTTKPTKEDIYRETHEKFNQYFVDKFKNEEKSTPEDRLAKEQTFIDAMTIHPKIKDLDIINNDEHKNSYKDFFTAGIASYVKPQYIKNFQKEFFDTMTKIKKPEVKQLDEKSIFKRDITILFSKPPQNDAVVVPKNEENENSDQEKFKKKLMKFRSDNQKLTKFMIREFRSLWETFLDNSKRIDNTILENLKDIDAMNQVFSDTERISDTDLKFMIPFLNENSNADVFAVIRMIYQNLDGEDFTFEHFINRKFKKLSILEDLKKIYKYFQDKKKTIEKLLLNDNVNTLLLYIRKYLVFRGKAEDKMLNANEVIMGLNKTYYEDFIRQIKDRISDEYFINEIWNPTDIDLFDEQKNNYSNILKFMKLPRRRIEKKTEKPIEKIINNYFILNETDFVGKVRDETEPDKKPTEFEEIVEIIKDYDKKMEELTKGLSLSKDDTKTFLNNLRDLLSKLRLEFKKQQSDVKDGVNKRRTKMQKSVRYNRISQKKLKRSVTKKSMKKTVRKSRSIKKKRTRSLQKRFRRMNK